MTAIWTGEDAARWRRLIDCAEATLAEPSRSLGDMGRLVDKAWKAVIPTADEVGRADCWRFIQFARTWVALPAEGRAENLEALALNLAKAAAWVRPNAAPAAPVAQLPARPVRPRRDIDDMPDDMEG